MNHSAARALSLPSSHRRRFGRGLALTLICAIAALLVTLLSAPLGAQPPADEVAVVLHEVIVLGLPPEREAIARAVVQAGPGDRITEAAIFAVTEALKATDLPREHFKLRLAPLEHNERPPGVAPGALHVRLVLDFRPPFAIRNVRVFPLIPVDAEIFAGDLALRAGAPHDPAAIASQAGALREQARAMGYETARVTPFEDRATSTALRLTFFIEDDTPPTLKSLTLRRAGLLRSSQFRAALEKLPEHAIDKNTTITAPLLIDLRELSKRFFSDQGWLDVDSNLEEVRVKNDKNGRRIARLYYGIERGERYKIHQPEVFGFEGMPAGAFDSMIEHYDGRNFSRMNLDEMREALHGICADHGYLAPEIMLARTARAGEARVDVAAQIDQGTTSTLREIRITHRPYPGDPGFLSRATRPLRRHIAPRVSDEAIARQITAQLGAQLDRAVLAESELNLYGMQIFDDIRLDTLPTSDTHRRDLTVEVRDKLTAALNFTAGWSDTTGALGGLSFIERNLFGVGDQLSVSTQFSELDWRGSVSYLDRNWTLGDRILGARRAPSLTYTAFYQDGFYDEYIERHLGGLLTLNYRRLDAPVWRDTWQLRAERITFDPDRDRDEYEEDFEDYFAATVAYYVSHDTRKFGDWSREGHHFRTGLELGDAGGFLARWTADYDLYVPITKRLGWVLRAHLGLLPRAAGAVGLADRFQGGGAEDMRGFETRGIGPVDPRVADLRTGGATKLLVSNELRLRVHDNVMLLGFVDAGSLSGSAVSFNSWRLSAGVGGRLKIPSMNSEVFVYLTEPLASQEDDDETSVHFGVRFVF